MFAVTNTLTALYVAVAGIFLGFLYLLGGFVYNAFFHPLAQYPGPLLYRGSRVPRLVQEFRGNTIHAWSALHNKYGPVVRIAPNQLSYISTAAWQDIYGARGLAVPTTPTSDDGQRGAGFRSWSWSGSGSGSGSGDPPSSGQPTAAVATTRGGWGNNNNNNNNKAAQMRKEQLVFPGDDFDFFSEAAAKPMISCDAVNHARHRRVVNYAFSDRALREYEPTLSEHVGRMVVRLRERAASLDVVNMVDWFNFTMFDITSHLVFGETFGCLVEGKYHPWVARVFPGMKLIAWSGVVAGIPGLGRLIQWVLPKAVSREADAHIQEVVDMTRKRMAMTEAGKTSSSGDSSVDAEAGNGGGGGDLLSFSSSTPLLPPSRPDFMTHIHPHAMREKGNGLSDEELYLDSQLLTIAGSETTSTLLCGATYYLSQHPAVRARLEAEVRAAFATEAEATPTATLRLPYLGAVINECLRLYPPGAINMPRTVPLGGATIDGAYVPAGMEVGIAQFAAYRSPLHFRDPLSFAPERWLGDERYASDNRDVFQPFSHGPRNCVGRNLAVVELRFVLARLLWSFDVDVLAGQEAWPKQQKTYLSWAKPPLMARLHLVR